MKKLSLLAITALTLVACQNNSYKINGATDEKSEGQTAYLIDSNTNEAVDSCVIANQAFTFEGKIAEPQIYRAQIGRRNNIVLTEPGSKIFVDFTATGPNQMAVTDNGGANDAKNEFMANLNQFMSKKQEKYRELVSNNASQGEIYIYSQQAQAEMDSLYRICISSNKDNIFGAFMLANLANNLYSDIATLDSAINAVKYSAGITQLQEARRVLSYKEQTRAGNPFIDFKGKSVNGEEIALSNYVGKGKYVIVDFWASWCGPCRAEIPNLLAINKEFGGENFEVIGVNVWDNEQKFQESLKSEGINYAQIYVPQTENVTELYGIEGIPQIMLIGPDGTILKRDLRGEGIKEAVKEALGK